VHSCSRIVMSTEEHALLVAQVVPAGVAFKGGTDACAHRMMHGFAGMMPGFPPA
jgi:hypothetical protein